MIEHFFGWDSKRVLAASDSAARCVRGQTVHAAFHVGGHKFKLEISSVTSTSLSPKLVRQCHEALID